MEIKTIDNFQFIIEYGSTRTGFFHKATLFKKQEHGESYREITTARASYINRTWEQYAFQSVMKQAVQNQIDDAKDELKNKVKRNLDIGRMTSKAKEKLAQEIEASGEIVELQNLYKKL